MTKTEERTLSQVATEFGEHDAAIKKATPLKDKAKKEMFTKFDELVDPEEILVEIGDETWTQDEVEAEVQKRYPAFEVEALLFADIRWEVILVERPELKGYTFVNADDGNVYGRQVRAGKTYLDDEALCAKNPELWYRVSEIPYFDFIRKLAGDTVDLDEHWEGPRAFIGLTKIEDPEDLAEVQKYIYESEPTVAVAPPREAKPEELEGLDE